MYVNTLKIPKAIINMH